LTGQAAYDYFFRSEWSSAHVGDGVADREKIRPVEDDGAEKCGRPASSGVTSALGYNLVQEASDA